MRDVYHHFTHPEEIARSLAASLKPGGRLAIIDFEPRPGMAAPEGVPSNREGHGIRPDIIVAEITPAGPSAVRTISDWSAPRADRRMFLVLFKK
jgi:hypothetical protein